MKRNISFECQLPRTKRYAEFRNLVLLKFIILWPIEKSVQCRVI